MPVSMRSVDGSRPSDKKRLSRNGRKNERETEVEDAIAKPRAGKLCPAARFDLRALVIIYH